MKFLYAIGVCVLTASCAVTKTNQEVTMQTRSEQDMMNPVRQGGIQNRPFWNTYATRFIYVPAFEFPKDKNAAYYRFQAKDRTKVIHTFTADSPCALLTPIWKDLPVGPVYLTVDAMDKNGKKIRTVGKRVFYRNAPFNDGYPPASRSYSEAAKMAFDYLFNMKAVQSLATGKPDMSLVLFCYPSKMYSSIIKGMVNYAEMVPEKKVKAMAIACGAADYLIKKAVPKGQPLEYLPQTYEGDQLTAKRFAGTIMMLYPAEVGSAMINLYKTVKEPKYLDYAVKIGDTYLRLQQPNGSWYLNLDIATGKQKENNYCVPTSIMSFLEELADVTKEKKYALAAKKGMPHLRKIYETFNWEGQFEDVEAQKKPYLNMTFHNATAMYLYLCKKGKVSQKTIQEAREIQRYSEDQFVIWEQPGWAGSDNVWNWRTKKELQTEKWGWFRYYHVPCVLEQYRCYVPIDSASAKMISFYLLMYKLEKNPLDLAKARALGDSLTRLQENNGRIPTWAHRDCPVNGGGTGGDWINCMYYTAGVLKTLGELKD